MVRDKGCIARALGRILPVRNADIRQRLCLSIAGSVQHSQFSAKLLKKGMKQGCNSEQSKVLVHMESTTFQCKERENLHENKYQVI